MTIDRRASILAAASELLKQRGPGSLSVRNVAAAAGIGASTLRHYFPTQADLQVALAADVFRREVVDLRIADTSAPAAERLAECFEQFLPSDEAGVAQLASWISSYAAAVGLEALEPQRRLLEVLEAEARILIDGWLAVLAGEDALKVDAARARVLLQALLDGLALSLLIKEREVGLAEAKDALREVITGVIVADRTVGL